MIDPAGGSGRLAGGQHERPLVTLPVRTIIAANRAVLTYYSTPTPHRPIDRAIIHRHCAAPASGCGSKSNRACCVRRGQSDARGDGLLRGSTTARSISIDRLPGFQLQPAFRWCAPLCCCYQQKQHCSTTSAAEILFCTFKGLILSYSYLASAL